MKPKNKDKDYKIDSVEKVMELLESVIEEENAHYLVVETNIEQDTDIPYLSIWDKQEYYDFKEEYFKKQKEKEKVRKNECNKCLH